MSYGQKPNAWARTQGQQNQINPNIFSGQLGMAPPTGQHFPAMPAMTLNALVNQAAFTNMSNVLAQAQRSQLIPQQVSAPQQQQQRPQTSTSPTRNQRTFIGVITKLMDTYGFVDEDVFFQTNVIRGAMPRVGDRVMVEASFNPSMPFKWNAYRIQLMQQDSAPMQQKQSHPPQRQIPQQHQTSAHHHQQQQQHNGSSYGSGSGGGGGGRWSDRGTSRDEPTRPMVDRRPAPYTQSRRSPFRSSDSVQVSKQRSSPVIRRSPPPRSVPKRISPPPRKTDVSNKRPVIDRERSPSVRDVRDSTRTRSPTSSKRDANSPPRRRQRIIPRYHCSLPKYLPPIVPMKYAELRKRYGNLYIPSDFVRCEMSWLNSFQMESPPRFSPHAITFNVLHKDVDVPLPDGDTLPVENPPDADSRYMVKVLLLSHPGLSALLQKMFGLLPDGSIDESVETQPFIKNLNLLVGYRNKEVMAIGGAWSPSLDGQYPMDPQTLIKTATRTTFALTGIDLSGCSRWYKMVHFRYFRPERNRIDSVVLMLPDTSAVPGFMPTAESYSALEETLKKQLFDKLSAIDAEEFPKKIPSQDEGNAMTGSDAGPKESSITANETPSVGANEGMKPADECSATKSEAQDKTGTKDDENPAGSDSQLDTSTDSLETAQDPTAPKTKKNWSQLNVKGMKVAELRDQLELRGLDSRGVKNILVQRLQEAVDKEKAEEGESASPSSQEKAGDKTTAPKDSGETADSEDGTLVVNIKEEIIELMETDEAADDKVDQTEELVEKPDEPNNEQKEKERKELEKQRKELEKEKEKFEKEKKEKKSSLERHYVFPKEPCKFVYPSKTAKSGKFDCKIISIASLLDYRSDDNKETSFEVFLFAEALKEAVDRANAFVVYTSLYNALDKEAESKRRNEVLARALTDADEVQIIDGEIGGNGADKKEDKKESPKTEKEDKEKQKDDASSHFRAFIHDVDTFSAFAHFDTNVCGYLLDRDLEEMIYSIDLNISRGDILRLVKKLSSKDRVNYRNLTDKWVNKNGDTKYFPTSENALSSSELIRGHWFDENESGAANVQPQTRTDGGSTPDITKSGVVFYKGSVLNIQQNIEHCMIVEKERSDALLKNEQLEYQLKTTKEQKDQIDKKKRRLEDDLERYKKKLHSSEKGLKSSQDELGQIKSALMDCKRYGERVIGAVEKIFPPPPPPADESSKKNEKEVLVLVESDDASKKGEKTSKKSERASSCPKFTI